MPDYFQGICQESIRRWEILENDEILAAPWRQLFAQVRDPRNVLSELLQNADDAGASYAICQFDEEAFILRHNGQDFNEEQFSSLCRFGYSNKRALHTIGFRGIGFKSTFSLGDEVEVFSPSLSVVFKSKRFTLPEWLDDRPDTGDETWIRVKLKDASVHKVLKQVAKTWKQNPLSLIFFRKLRLLDINGFKIGWQESETPAPTDYAKWMRPINEKKEYLLFRSKELQLPQEAIDEIRQERMILDEAAWEQPVVHIDIVLNKPGQLFVVLPTNVRAPLPFACNAPFLQDPDRKGIKDPIASPTNNFLLTYVGDVVRQMIYDWLNNEAISFKDRHKAYGLLPKPINKGNETGVDRICAEIIIDQIVEGLKQITCLLTDEEKVVGANQAISIPRKLVGIWSNRYLLESLGCKEEYVLSTLINKNSREAMLEYKLCMRLADEKVLEYLSSEMPRRPESNHQLLQLWSWVSAHVRHDDRYWYEDELLNRDVRIVPVTGEGNTNELFAAEDTVNMNLPSLPDDDVMSVILSQVKPIDPTWISFIQEDPGPDYQDDIERARGLFHRLPVHEGTELSALLKSAAEGITARKPIDLEALVRLTHLTAKNGLDLNNGFPLMLATSEITFVNREILYVDPNRIEYSRSGWVIYNSNQEIKELIPPETRRAIYLNHEYSNTRKNNFEEKVWNDWANSTKSGFHRFIPLVRKVQPIVGKHLVYESLGKYEFTGQVQFPYLGEQFRLIYFDFPHEVYTYWHSKLEEDPFVWCKVLDAICQEPNCYLNQSIKTKFVQDATRGGNVQAIASDLIPQWILGFRELPCLRDTNGNAAMPSELLYRTPETEQLINDERFIERPKDNDKFRPLLRLLGVNDKPINADRILDRLRALSKADKPVVQEVAKWYQRLDQIFSAVSTSMCKRIKDAFRDESLILTTGHVWAKTNQVFRMAGQYGFPAILESVQSLALWTEVGVLLEPTREDVLSTIKALPKSELVDIETRSFVVAAMKRYGTAIWHDLNGWLSITDRWQVTTQFKYYVGNEDNIPKNLERSLQDQIADFRFLIDQEVLHLNAGIPSLIDEMNYKANGIQMLDKPAFKPWLQRFAATLVDFTHADERHQNHVRSIANRLAGTLWVNCDKVRVQPYLNLIPIGEIESRSVIWIKDELYVDAKEKRTRIAKILPDYLASYFHDPEIREALHWAFDRDPDLIEQYLIDNLSIESGTGEREKPAKKEVECQGIGSAVQPEPEIDIPVDEGPESSSREKEEKSAKPSTRAMPSLIERFALTNRFREVNPSHYVHDDGRAIRRSRQSLFPWQLLSGTRVIRQLYPIEKDLYRQDLEIPKEIWSFLDEHPARCSLILLDDEDQPIEMNGTELKSLVDRERIILHISEYRLRYHAPSPEID